MRRIPTMAPGSQPSPVIFNRQRQLLGLLNALGGRVGNLDFQKLLFLYCQESGAANPYEFVPYKFGAFSFTSYADRRKLVARGLLVDEEHHWQLTDEGKHVVGPADQQMTSFARRHRLRGEALIADTYRRFPYYAIRSEIADRVLRGDVAALRQIEAARSAVKGVARLLTLGYEGRTLEGYLNVLLQAGVTLLCDVRRNPISRKYGFSKRTLAKACAGVGIRYEHLPELGIGSAKRRNLATQADYDALFAEYKQSTLTNQGATLGIVLGWIQSGERVALTCYEREPKRCHRLCVAERLEQHPGCGSRAVHL